MATREYVIITPARNEGDCIENTIRSVLAQTVPPQQWIIVSDNSTDSTDDIVAAYARSCSYMKLVRTAGRAQRNFSSKVSAFNAGCAALRASGYGFIGNLDADITFEPAYFASVLNAFERNPQLGIAGGIIMELIHDAYVGQHISLNSVAGAVQLFRRECFEAVGGYRPLPYGGIDAAAEIMARMHGWEVQTFPELKVLHHRRVAADKGSLLHARFRQGKMFYVLGYHPLFQLFRSIYRITDKPHVWGSLVLLLGYCWAAALRYRIGLPDNALRYLRTEQLRRLKEVFLKRKKAATQSMR